MIPLQALARVVLITELQETRTSRLRTGLRNPGPHTWCQRTRMSTPYRNRGSLKMLETPRTEPLIRKARNEDKKPTPEKAKLTPVTSSILVHFSSRFLSPKFVLENNIFQVTRSLVNKVVCGRLSKAHVQRHAFLMGAFVWRGALISFTPSRILNGDSIAYKHTAWMTMSKTMSFVCKDQVALSHILAGSTGKN